MKRRTVLSKQSVKKRKKKRKRSAIFALIRGAIPVIFKGFVLFTIVMGISLSLIYFYHYLLTSSFIKLEQVKIAGVDENTRKELIDMCGLAPGQNLLFLNLSALKQKMEKHPWIRTVHLTRRFPHTLFVHAEKHKPLALVSRDGLYYMDRQCEIFKKITQSDDIDFPVITGVSQQTQKAREQLHRAVRVMNVLEFQKGHWSLKELSEIHVREEALSLYFNHLPAAIIVRCNGISNKMNGLKKLAEHLRRTGKIQQVTAINLDSIDGAVVSFRKG